MVYQEKFVAVIKCDGKVLRERDKDTVYLPFGSEYSILLKNLNSRAALVSISIDGKDVLNGRDLIVPAGKDLELERFLDQDMSHGHRFKFIQKTKEISDFRGDKVDDGIVRVEYKFEAAPPEIKITNEHHHHHHHSYDYYIKPWWPWGAYPKGPVYGSTLTSRSVGGGGTCSASYNANNLQANNCMNDVIGYCAPVMDCGPLPDEGITVQGSDSNQAFTNGYIGQLEMHSEVIILRLRGVASNQTVQQPITVKERLRCPTCGRKSVSAAKFCANCGTALY